MTTKAEIAESMQRLLDTIAELRAERVKLRAELAHAKREINDWRVYFKQRREQDKKFLAELDAEREKWDSLVEMDKTDAAS